MKIWWGVVYTNTETFTDKQSVEFNPSFRARFVGLERSNEVLAFAEVRVFGVPAFGKCSIVNRVTGHTHQL